MEGRFEQLVIFVVVIAFALFDLLLRWAKRREQQQPGLPEEEDDGELAFEDETAGEIEMAEAAGEVYSEHEEPQAVHKPAPPLPPIVAPPVARVPAQAAHSWVPVRAAAPPPSRAERPPRRKHRALGPGAARRGIVLMTVLGPCRAQEMDRR